MIRAFSNSFLLIVAIATSVGLFAATLNAQTNLGAFEATILERISHPFVRVQMDDSVLDYLGQWGSGPCTGVAVMGNHVLTGSGPTILWLDHSDTRRPVVEWETLSTPRAVYGYAWAFNVQDSLGYALDDGGLIILDLRDVHSPTIIGRLALGGVKAGLVVEGSYAFVKNYFGSVLCVDVSNPTLPFIRSIASSFTEWGPMTISDHRLYVGARSSNDFVEYMDVSNPDSIRVTVLYSLPPFRSTYASDSLLIASRNNLFMIYSITAPASPMLLSTTELLPNDPIVSVVYRGNTAYIGTGERKIVILDISDRSNPVIRNIHSEPSFPPDLPPSFLVIHDTLLYVSYRHGVAAYSTTHADSLIRISLFPTGDETRRAFVKNNLAYVTSGAAGIWMVDLTDPQHPITRSNFRFPGYTNDLFIDSTIAYVSVSDRETFGTEGLWNGIATIDISRPDSLRVLDTIAIPDAYSIAKSGNLLFVTRVNQHSLSSDTLTIVDVSNPSNMRVVGMVGQGFRAQNMDVCAKDSIAFLATNDELRIIDCRDPGHPQQLSSILPPSYGVSLSGQRAYVLCRPSGLSQWDSLFVIDISDLSAPVILGGVRKPNTLPVWGQTVESAIAGNILFWAGSLGFGACDISNSNQPRIVSSAPYSYPVGVHAVGETVIMSDRTTGLWFFRVNKGTTPVPPERKTFGEGVRLSPNYPNPFNASTNLHFSTSTPERVKIDVFDMLGQHVSTLFDGIAEPGDHSVEFNANGFPSGVYFYRLVSDNKYQVGRAVLLR